MKKITVLLVTILFISLIGCDFFSGTTKAVTTTSNHTTQDSLTTVSTTTTEITSPETASYESLFDDNNYKKFVIYFSQANFDKLVYDMENYHDEFGSYRDNTIQEVDVTYYDGLGTVMELHEVGFRTKGNVFTRVLPVIKIDDQVVGYQQVSFQLEFNATFEYLVNSTDYNALKSREVFDLEQLNFKNIRLNDTSAVTESVAYDLYREAGVYTSNTSYAIIYFDIDGTVIPYGLFLIQEPIDDVFVERYFGKNEDSSIGDLYKCTWQTGPATLKNNYNDYSLGVSNYLDGFRRSYALKTNKEEADFTSFTDFIGLVNQTSVTSYYDSVSTSLDTDAFARALAMGFLIGSADDYRSNANNYYMYFNEGEAYYIPFDMDNSMGTGWNPYTNYGIDLLVDQVQPSNYFGGVISDFVLAYYLLTDPVFLDIYLEYLQEYSSESGLFNYTTFYDEYVLVYDLYYDEIIQNSHLGLSNFNLSERIDMTAYDYFSLKLSNVRDQLSELGYE